MKRNLEYDNNSNEFEELIKGYLINLGLSGYF